MSEFGGMNAPPEIDPDIAQIQARSRGLTVDQQASQLPTTAFVAALNGQSGNIALGAGTVSPGVTVAFTNGIGTVSLNLTGFGTLATIKCNFVAVVAPAVTDDSGDGYTVGSQWIDTVLGDVYQAVDVTVGAAVWRKLN